MKILLNVVLIVFAITTTQAQVYIKGGQTISSISFSDGEGKELKSIHGYQVGLGYQGEIQPSFYFLLEANLIQKGVIEERKAASPGIEVHQKHEIKINYVEIPVLLKFDTGKKNFKLFVASGISFAMLAEGRSPLTVTQRENGVTTLYKFEGRVNPFEPYQPLDPDDPFLTLNSNVYLDNTVDLAFQFGAGVTVANLFIADFRYGHGLINLASDRGQTRTIQLSAGVFLYRKKSKIS